MSLTSPKLLEDENGCDVLENAVVIDDAGCRYLMTATAALTTISTGV